jgi:hypothetical protein
MHRFERIRMVALSVPIWLCLATFAQGQRAEPVAYVTVVSGAGATRAEPGPDGVAPSFPSNGKIFSDVLSGVAVGQGVVTLEGGAALVALPDHATAIYLDQDSELRLGSLPGLDNAVPVSLTLLKGRAYVVHRESDARWLLVAAKSDLGDGYTMSRRGALVLSADSTGVGFAALRGEVLFFEGDVPAGALLDRNGEPAVEGGGRLPEGHHLTTRGRLTPTSGIPDALSGSAIRARLSQATYAFGLRVGERWVEDAEKGDLTPVRGTGRGAPSLFPAEGLAPGFAFDQPRSAAVAPAPRVSTQPLRAQAVSPVQALLKSGRPASVVVGQRLKRTRIIGNPGTSAGPIRVNPNVEPLIRLPRG